MAAVNDQVKEPWTKEELQSENVSKKQILEFLTQKASSQFLQDNKLTGKVPNLVKAYGKPDLIKLFDALFVTKSFRNEQDEKEQQQQEEKQENKQEVKPEKKQDKEPKKEKEVESPKFYTKAIVKRGDGNSFPNKGDMVSVRYKGSLENGTVFDTNEAKKAKKMLDR